MPKSFVPSDMAALILASPHNRRIVVMGVSGSGKTTVGKALARALGVLFRDGDDLHPASNVAKMRAGQALSDDDRWEWLELVANSLRRDAPVVIACSALRAVYRNHIRIAAGTAVQFIYLSGTRDLIAQRMEARQHNHLPQGLLESQFETLEPPSAAEAMIIPITLTVAQQVAMILEKLATGATSSTLPFPHPLNPFRNTFPLYLGLCKDFWPSLWRLRYRLCNSEEHRIRQETYQPRSTPMRCPFCGNVDTQVKDSRPAEDHVSIRRRRFCPACGGRFTTYERVQLRDLVVVKSSGKREDFDRSKLERSIRIAMQKRPIDPERIDQMISGIVRRLESLGDTDVSSKIIGEIVMESLARIDTVGYVRFASVYKNFQAADDFDRFVSELRPNPATEE